MEEINRVIAKYKGIDLQAEMSNLASLSRFSTQFYKDVAEIYDSITRIRHLDRNPTGFNFNDAAILGLLVRIWKILKEIIFYYEKNNAGITSLLDRQLIETAIIAKYLLVKGDAVIEDYRKCSYKDRLDILSEIKNSKKMSEVKAGARLSKSIEEKMTAEGFTIESFEEQKKNNWKLQGKSFYKIFSEMLPKEIYKFLYGVPSESIHGSWNDSLDFHLAKNDDGTFSTNPHPIPADIRFVTPALKICHEPFELWLRRIDCMDDYLDGALKWIQVINMKLFYAFDNLYPPPGKDTLD